MAEWGSRTRGRLAPFWLAPLWFASLWLPGATFVSLAAGCSGSTGDALISVPVYAAGPTAAVNGEYRFTSGRGYAVLLTRARLRVGAVYLNETVPTAGAQATSCWLPGRYVLEEASGLTVDALSPSLQAFPSLATATTSQAATGEVWLTGGPIDAESDDTVIVDVAGTAVRDGTSYPFAGQLTIGKNRVSTPPDPARPGASPLCKQRIASPIAANLAPRRSGALVLRIDPAGWFSNVDFSALEASPTGLRVFSNKAGEPPSDNLLSGVRAAAGVYGFEWASP